MPEPRVAELARNTAETRITVSIRLDGTGEAQVATGIGFFDHMLTHIAKHGLFDLTVEAAGDLHIDAHHTVEDVGITLGKAFREALADMRGVRRFGHAVVPMDEALAEAAIDISGRPFLVFQADFAGKRVGAFDAELAEEFFRAFAMNARITLHLELRRGANVHHGIEALFKAFARALDDASRRDGRSDAVPSTKGMLDV